VSALAYFLEDEDLPTVAVSVIRLQSERLGNPRSLWVPFELGRPLGTPNDAVFQKAVIRSALELLEIPTGPVLLVDYPHEDPSATDRDEWHPPFNFTDTIPNPSDSAQFAAALEDEMQTLAPLHRAFVARNRRTMVGVSDMDIEGCRQFFASYLADPATTAAANPVTWVPWVVDDLRYYYLESMMFAHPVVPSSLQLESWFWDRTVLARGLLALRARLIANSDAMTRFVGERALLPGPQRHRLGL
jgi:hypothetical protein